MGSILSYALASSILLICGYLCYKWILAGERQHAANRIALYLILAASFILPAFSGMTSGHGRDVSPGGTEIEIGEISAGLLTDMPQSAAAPIWPVVLAAVYFAGALLTLIYSLYGASQIVSIVRNGEKIRKGRFILVITDRHDIAPFSWLRYYVINRNDWLVSGDVISIHERRHLALCHWADLAVVQIVEIFQWFNPAAWLIGEEFKSLHEYQADEAVISSGADMRQYQTLLIKKAVGTRFQVLANSLNHSKLKKRVTMMYKSSPTKTRRLGALLLVPAMGLGCLATGIPAIASVLQTASETSLSAVSGDKDNEFSAKYPVPAEILSDSASEDGTDSPVAATGMMGSPAERGAIPAAPPAEEAGLSTPSSSDETASAPDKNEIYVAVEKQAEFPGGMKELMEYLSQNIQYPKEAKDKDIQGRVVVKFVIGKDGKIGDAEIVKGVDPLLDEEAIRVVKSMPAWIPSQNNGVPVASYFNLPVSFKLSTDKPAVPADSVPAAK